MLLAMIFSGSDIENSGERQEDKWGPGEFSSEDEGILNEMSSGENSANHFENGETKLTTSDSASTRNYSEAQDVSDDDVVELEREVEEMMQRMKELQRRMSEDGGAEEILGVEVEGGEGRWAREEDEKMKASMEAIEEMETILRAKAGEERRAKLWRIQVEEESRDILRELPCAKVSNGVRINLEEFRRLLDDWERTESGVVSLESVKAGGLGEGKISEGKKKEEKRTGKGIGQVRKTRNLKFVEKNIELARCGRGTLSLTEEEKQRIETLLVEAEEPLGENLEHGQSRPGLSRPLYAIDDEVRAVLSRIDQELKAVGKAESPEVSEEMVEERSEKGDVGGKKRRSRLAEINKLLSEMKTVSEEEIIPLSEEEMMNLVEQSKRSLVEEGGREEDGGQSALGGGWGRDVISELVSNAKLLMPKFKYRFNNC